MILAERPFPAVASYTGTGEREASYGVSIQESTLADVWEGQQFPAEALRLEDDSAIRVVYRGRRQGGPGPDFRDAVLVFPGEELRYGDIELHVDARDWRR